MTTTAKSAAERAAQYEQEAASFTFTAKQNEFWRAMLTGKYRYMALGGAIRGTKTFTTLAILFMLMQRFPRSRYGVVRASLPDLRRTVVPSVEKFRENYLGGWLGPLNQSKWTWTALNGSKLILMAESLETDPDLDRFKGFETNGFLGEEANELNIKTHYKMIERAGSYIIPPTAEQQTAINRAVASGMDQRSAFKKYGPEQPPPMVFYTFNPADNWVRDVFYDPWHEGTLQAPFFYMPATILDNPFVTDEYLESLKNLPKEEYDRFVRGIWGKVRAPNQLITTDMIVTAKQVRPVDGIRKEGLDVAAYGGDIIVFAHINGNALEETEPMADDGSKEITNIMWQRALERANDLGIDEENYTIDVVGLGGGPADDLTANGFDVNRFVSGATPIEREVKPGVISMWKFADLRSQAYWEFREKLRMGLFSLKKHCPKELIQELTAHRYKITNRVIQVLPKDKVKEEIGRSPDYADAVVMAAFDWPERDENWTTPSVSSRRLSQHNKLANQAVRGRG